jgi:hypothetical protein
VKPVPIVSTLSCAVATNWTSLFVTADSRFVISAG